MRSVHAYASVWDMCPMIHAHAIGCMNRAGYYSLKFCHCTALCVNHAALLLAHDAYSSCCSGAASVATMHFLATTVVYVWH